MIPAEFVAAAQRRVCPCVTAHSSACVHRLCCSCLAEGAGLPYHSLHPPPGLRAPPGTLTPLPLPGVTALPRLLSNRPSPKPLVDGKAPQQAQQLQAAVQQMTVQWHSRQVYQPVPMLAEGMVGHLGLQTRGTICGVHTQLRLLGEIDMLLSSRHCTNCGCTALLAGVQELADDW